MPTLRLERAVTRHIGISVIDALFLTIWTSEIQISIKDNAEVNADGCSIYSRSVPRAD
jgi:hypothetical protein